MKTPEETLKNSIYYSTPLLKVIHGNECGKTFQLFDQLLLRGKYSDTRLRIEKQMKFWIGKNADLKKNTHKGFSLYSGRDYTEKDFFVVKISGRWFHSKVSVSLKGYGGYCDEVMSEILDFLKKTQN